MADPAGGRIVCHNDVCLENVVFRDGLAVGLLDFDFAAPGRPAYDLAQMARMCVPVDDDVSATRGSDGRPPTVPPGSGSSPTPTASTPQDGPSCSTCSPAPSSGAVSSCAAGSRPAIRTSPRCGTRWAAWSASTAGVAGGPPIASRFADALR